MGKRKYFAFFLLGALLILLVGCREKTANNSLTGKKIQDQFELQILDFLNEQNVSAQKYINQINEISIVNKDRKNILVCNVIAETEGNSDRLNVDVSCTFSSKEGGGWLLDGMSLVEATKSWKPLTGPETEATNIELSISKLIGMDNAYYDESRNINIENDLEGYSSNVFFEAISYGEYLNIVTPYVVYFEYRNNATWEKVGAEKTGDSTYELNENIVGTYSCFDGSYSQFSKNSKIKLEIKEVSDNKITLKFQHLKELGFNFDTGETDYEMDFGNDDFVTVSYEPLPDDFRIGASKLLGEEGLKVEFQSTEEASKSACIVAKEKTSKDWLKSLDSQKSSDNYTEEDIFSNYIIITSNVIYVPFYSAPWGEYFTLIVED